MKRAAAAAPARQPKRTRGAVAAVPRAMKRAGRWSDRDIHTFHRSLFLHHNITDVALQNNGTAFVLSAMPNYTEFTALFDVFRIRKVRVTFICDRNTAPVGTGAVNNTLVPNLWVTTDYDDATPYVTEADWDQVEGATWTQLSKPVYHTVWYPRVAQAVYNGAFTGYGNSLSWVDCNSPSTQFYGIKWAYDCASGVGAATVIAHINIRFDFTIDCKGVH